MSTTDKLNGFGPLAGVKVVELCEWVAAPAAVRCLSEMGATVIKTEPLHAMLSVPRVLALVAKRTILKILRSTLTTPTKTW